MFVIINNQIAAKDMRNSKAFNAIIKFFIFFAIFTFMIAGIPFF